MKFKVLQNTMFSIGRFIKIDLEKFIKNIDS